MTTLISLFLFVLLSFSLAGSASRIENETKKENETKTPTSTTTKKPEIAKVEKATTTPKTAPTAVKPPAKTPTIPKAPTPAATEPAPAISAGQVAALSNSERLALKIAPLRTNSTLTAMAKAKLNDMVARGYFAHESPSGETIVDLSKEFGYSYSNLGENIARGDFTTSASMVTGWMNSPGHRANILDKNYNEIGVAVAYVNYLGRKQWVGVQIFGSQQR